MIGAGFDKILCITLRRGYCHVFDDGIINIAINQSGSPGRIHLGKFTDDTCHTRK